MKKKRSVYDNPSGHLRLFQALEGENQGSPNLATRENVMEYIHEVFDSCYFLGMTPLRELRRILPQYQWKYHSIKNEKHIQQILASCDFSWMTCWANDEDEIELVTATKIDRIPAEPLKYFWAGYRKGSEVTDRLNFAIEHKTNPVYWEVE